MKNLDFRLRVNDINAARYRGFFRLSGSLANNGKGVSLTDTKTLTSQWAKLAAVTSVHFFIDTFGGMFPAIMPDIRIEFGWSLATASWVLCILTLCCNAGQVATGHLRADKDKPLFLQLGMVLSTAICFMCLLGGMLYAFQIMLVLAVMTGLGIALTHPEGLRAVHTLDKIPSPISTAIFMTGGAMGFASGGFIGSFLVSRFGLNGLLYFLVFPVFAIALVYLLRVKLAVEPKSGEVTKLQDEGNYSFWAIFLMAVPTTAASTVLVYLLPTRLNELGFELTFGGFSTMLFGFGGAGGSIVWSIIAHKKGQLGCAVASIVLGLPLLVWYLFKIEDRNAVYLLIAAGFCLWGCYPLLVSICRTARGMNLGGRMGMIVGGAWGLGGLIEMLLVLIEERFDLGVETLLYFVPVSFMMTAVIGLAIMYGRSREKKVS